MNGDVCEGGSGTGPVAAGAWWTDLGLLVNGDPARVWGLLDSGAGPEARLMAAVYRASAHVHRAATAGVRRHLLALDAARYGDMELAARISAVAVAGEPAPRWQVEWSTGSQVDPRARHVIDDGTCWTELATAVVDGRLVAATQDTESNQSTLWMWDLVTGEQIGDCLADHTRVCALATTTLEGRPVAVLGEETAVWVWDLATGGPIGDTPEHGDVREEEDVVVCAMATTTLQGRPVALTSSWYGPVRLWDLATREQIGALPHDHFDALPYDNSFASLVATAVVEGRLVAVTDGYKGTLRVWDLATGEQTGALLHDRTVSALATTVMDGRPVAVTGDETGTLRMWDLATRQPIGEPWKGHRTNVRKMATAEVEGRPVAVTLDENSTVRVWDLATRQQIGEPLHDTGDRLDVLAVATGEVEGRPVAVTGGEEGPVRVWDLATCQPIGNPLQGHTGWVGAAATGEVEGRPVAVTGGRDGAVRVWDLATGEQIGEPLQGPTGYVLAVTTTVAVNGSRDGTVRVWDLATGEQIGEPLQGHTGHLLAAATGEVEGRQVAVTSCWDTVRVWDLATGTGDPMEGQTDRVTAVATTVLDGRQVAVTVSDGRTVEIWDLATRQQICNPLQGHTGRVEAVATGVMEGRPVAVTSSQDTVRIWDLATGERLGPELVFPEQVDALAVAPGGRLVVGFGHEVAVLSPPADRADQPPPSGPRGPATRE